MTKPTLPDDLEIAPGYRVARWQSLILEPDQPDSPEWNTAFEIFDARIRCRFLNPADVLIASETSCKRKTFGFVILAIDFMVIETLQGFREGKLDHTGESEKLIKAFLTRWDAFKNCLSAKSNPGEIAKIAKRIYKGYRCALHHSAATDGDLRVGVHGPMIQILANQKIRINRTRLHDELKREFEAYLDELRRPEATDLRCKFRKKMNSIAGLSS